LGEIDEVEGVQEGLEAGGLGEAFQHNDGDQAPDAAAVDGEDSIHLRGSDK